MTLSGIGAHCSISDSEEACAARDVQTTQELNPDLQTFEYWLAVNKDIIPLDISQNEAIA